MALSIWISQLLPFTKYSCNMYSLTLKGYCKNDNKIIIELEGIPQGHLVHPLPVAGILTATPVGACLASAYRSSVRESP